MKLDISAFRARYRSGISEHYNAWLHGGFVLAFGTICVVFFWSHAENVRPWEWLTLPVALIFHNWGEYMVHKKLGHHKRAWSALFYKRHTGDHHSFFAPRQMAYETPQDWRVIFFPPWLIVVYAVFALSVWWLLSAFNSNVAALFIGAMLLGYLSYEVFHAFEHLPATHPISRLPWVRQMRHLHEVHHARELMHHCNFNVVFPLWDWIFGTLDWQTDNASELRSMQHHVDIRRPPSEVMAYVSCPTRWNEWHPYQVAIKGPAGALPLGSHFKYTSERTGSLAWEVIDVVPGRLWRARARGRYGLVLCVTYECMGSDTGTRFTRSLEYHFSNWIGRMADRLFVNKRIERDSIELLRTLGEVAERVIPSSA